jgi:hypothetical protein
MGRLSSWFGSCHPGPASLFLFRECWQRPDLCRWPRWTSRRAMAKAGMRFVGCRDQRQVRNQVFQYLLLLSFTHSRSNFGVTIAGEFSGSPNDCGLFLRGVNSTTTNPDCPIYNDWQSFNATMKEGAKNFVLASLDAFQDFFFWTWKIGPSLESGKVETPLWSYQLGLENGWIPTDPRELLGKCASLGSAQKPFDMQFKPWQTGGETSSIAASSSESFP